MARRPISSIRTETHRNASLPDIIQNIPIGYSEGIYNDRRLSLARQVLAGGKGIRVFARELGGTDFISFYFYLTSSVTHLKPCERPEQKVIDLLRNSRPVVSE